MRKHYKLVSGIACIVLCLAILAFGVYAASTSLVKLSATVSFTPSTAKLTILGGISGCKESNPSAYYATNYDDDKNNHVNVDSEDDGTGAAKFKDWTYGSINFNDEYTETNGKTHPDPIYFFVQITNHVERDVDVIVKFTSDFSENIIVSCSYKIALNTSFDANTKDMYQIKGVSEAPMQTTTDGLVSEVASYDNKSTDIKPNTTIDFSNLNTSLSTIILAIKLEVNNADYSISNDTEFNFIVSVK